LARRLAIDLHRHCAAWILTVWLVKGKAVEDSQDARQEVLLHAYRVTSEPHLIGLGKVCRRYGPVTPVRMHRQHRSEYARDAGSWVELLQCDETPARDSKSESSRTSDHTGARRSHRWHLQGQANSAQQVGEARIASQRVEPGIHPDKGYSSRTIAIPSFEPGERLILFAQH
jgi:hypothetical protein